MPQPITITAADGTTLHGTHVPASGERAILISSAMGVPRRYYEAFATHASERGFDVVTFDFRGIGESRPAKLRGYQASMHDWGRLDLPAAIEWVTREVRPRDLTVIGHSAGGQLAGLAPNLVAASRLVFVASQSGYWRHWPHIRAVGLGMLWAVMPSIASLFGYFPGRRLRLAGEDLPKNVATQWAVWGRHRDYLFAYMTAHERAQYAAIARPLLAWSFIDDHYAPKPAVDALLRGYASARVEHRHVTERGVGHWGFFRKRTGAKLWDETLAWMG